MIFGAAFLSPSPRTPLHLSTLSQAPKHNAVVLMYHVYSYVYAHVPREDIPARYIACRWRQIFFLKPHTHTQHTHYCPVQQMGTQISEARVLTALHVLNVSDTLTICEFTVEKVEQLRVSASSVRVGAKRSAQSHTLTHVIFFSFPHSLTHVTSPHRCRNATGSHR